MERARERESERERERERAPARFSLFLAVYLKAAAGQRAPLRSSLCRTDQPAEATRINRRFFSAQLHHSGGHRHHHEARSHGDLSGVSGRAAVGRGGDAAVPVQPRVRRRRAAEDPQDLRGAVHPVRARLCHGELRERQSAGHARG